MLKWLLPFGSMALWILYWILGLCFLCFGMTMVSRRGPRGLSGWEAVGCADGQSTPFQRGTELLTSVWSRFAAANIINQSFYCVITYTHLKMETWLCVNEFLERRCWGKESQKSEDVHWYYHHHLNLFSMSLSLSSFLIRTNTLSVANSLMLENNICATAI